MKTSEAIKHFGNVSALARALHIRAPSIHEWGEYPPVRRQVQIQLVTNQALRAEPGALERVVGLAAIQQH